MEKRTVIRNSFGVGPEGWHSYDYHGEIVTGAGAEQVSPGKR